MKTNRPFVRLNSIVAILGVLFYLSGIAMADPVNNHRPPDGFDAVPDSDSFSDTGSDTFSETPTPTITPEPSRPIKKPANHKDKTGKMGNDGVVPLSSSGSAALIAVGVTLTPAGGTLGDNGLPRQDASLTVVIRNNSSVEAINFDVSVWHGRLPGQPPPIGVPADNGTTVAALGAFETKTLTFPFQLPPSPEAYIPWTFVDSGSVVAESNESDNLKSGIYGVMEIATVTPRRILIRLGDTVTFTATARPSGSGMSWPPGFPVLTSSPSGPGAPSGFGSLTTTDTGQAKFVFASDGTSTGFASATLTCGENFEQVFVEVEPPGIVGPENVPGLSRYEYRLLFPKGFAATNVKWSIDGNPPDALLVGATHLFNQTVEFKNLRPATITLSAVYTLTAVPGGTQSTVTNTQVVSINQVQLFNRASSTPAVGEDALPFSGDISFLVSDSPEKRWVTSNDPGSDSQKFVYKGSYRLGEDFVLIRTSDNPAINAWNVSVGVTLSSPPTSPHSLGSIEVGWIQINTIGAATAKYTPNVGTPTLTRTGKLPNAAVNGLDWLFQPPLPAPDNLWPWYKTTSMAKPTGSVDWTAIVPLSDRPVFALPRRWNPLGGGLNATALIDKGTFTEHFTPKFSVRTTDRKNFADLSYFVHLQTTFTVKGVFPTPSQSLVGSATWQVSPSPTKIPDLNITPAVILFSSGEGRFHMFIPNNP